MSLSVIEQNELNDYPYINGIIKTIEEQGSTVFYFTKSNRCAVLELTFNNKLVIKHIYELGQ